MKRAKRVNTSFRFRRYVRTPHSEGIYIFRARQKSSPSIAQFDFHISSNTYYGTLVIHTRMSKAELSRLIEQLEDQFVEMVGARDDFILTVYSAREVESFSDIYDDERRQEAPATSGDLNHISKTIVRVLGRHQRARGHLNEHALCAYFEKLGYSARRTSSILDQQKIDVVAKRDDEVIYAQAKLGTVSVKTIRALAAAVKAQENKKGKSVVAAIAGDRFPSNAEQIRRTLEAQYGLPILLVHKYQVLESAPEYRGALDTLDNS